ncbi:MAG: toll/interleukin-1 receptor domain-containing protein [Anaerolineae bacterium]|nr:toll/interleukin-1 receptor domain-containing protein [Anaerolineae bacterium]
MAGQRLRVFISYSRQDMEQADRLEIELNRLGFDAWIDRSKLQGGQVWEIELQTAIQECHAFILIVSSASNTSHYVRSEWQYAINLKKTIIPLMFEDIQISLLLSPFQYIDFIKNSFEESLNRLIAALELIQPVPVLSEMAPLVIIPEVPANEELFTPIPAPVKPKPSENDLFVAGAEAKNQADLDRAARYWTKLYEINPKFGNGDLSRQLMKLNEELLPIRVKRFTELANEACQLGDWGREIKSWDEVLRYQPRNREAAKRRKLAVLHNENSWYYENAKNCVLANRPEAAIEQLKMLYEKAPYYGDPENIARSLNMGVHQDYYTSKVTEDERKQRETETQSSYRRIIREQRELQAQKDRDGRERLRREKIALANRNQGMITQLEIEKGRIEQEIAVLRKEANRVVGSLRSLGKVVAGYLVVGVALLIAASQIQIDTDSNATPPNFLSSLAAGIAINCIVPFLSYSWLERRRINKRQITLQEIRLKEEEIKKIESQISQHRREGGIREPIDPKVYTELGVGLGKLAADEKVRNAVVGFIKNVLVKR